MSGMKRIIWKTLWVVTGLVLCAGSLSAQQNVVLMAEKELLEIQENQRRLFERMEASGANSLTEVEAQQIVAAYRNYLMRYPDSLEGLILYGKFFRRIGHNEEAMRVFLEARKREPKLAVIQQELGNCFAEEGEYKAALTCFLNAVELEPEQPVYHFQLGVLLTVYKQEFAEMEEFSAPILEEQATEAFVRAHELAPQNRDILLAWGEALEEGDAPDWQEILQVWEKLMNLTTNDIQRQIVGLKRARALIELKQYGQAKAQLSVIDLRALQQNRRELEARMEKPTQAAE